MERTAATAALAAASAMLADSSFCAFSFCLDVAVIMVCALFLPIVSLQK